MGFSVPIQLEHPESPRLLGFKWGSNVCYGQTRFTYRRLPFLLLKVNDVLHDGHPHDGHPHDDHPRDGHPHDDHRDVRRHGDHPQIFHRDDLHGDHPKVHRLCGEINTKYD